MFISFRKAEKQQRIEIFRRDFRIEKRAKTTK